MDQVAARDRPSRVSLWGLAAVAVALVVASAGAAPLHAQEGSSREAESLHPVFPILDGEGKHVLETGAPVSTSATCGGCHDTAFIEATSFHADVGLSGLRPPGQVPGGREWDIGRGFFGRWDPTTYRYLTPVGDSLIDLGTADWVRLFGARHAGGGPAEVSRQGQDLTQMAVTPRDPETHVQDPETGEWTAWDWSSSGTVELNCFLCHLPNPDNEARIEELEAGRFAWAGTATLNGSGIVERQIGQQVKEQGGLWKWQASAFGEDGSLVPQLAAMQDPTDENCGQCHGLVHTDEVNPVTTTGCKPDHWTTERTGQILSSHRIAHSGMNLADKPDLARAWDIHLERLLTCVDCHHSSNNPVYRRVESESRPDHLVFDARRMDLGDYLYRPDHRLTSSEDVSCSSCHDATAEHDWLAYKQRHFESLACEACHMPRLYAPARRQFDWTVVRPDGEPRIECRGVEGEGSSIGTLVTGYEPVLLPREAEGGGTALAPYNLIASWYWVYDDPPRPVREVDLEAAYLADGQYLPDVVDALDENGDGEIAIDELQLDTPEKVALVAGRLESLGLRNPRIVGEFEPHAISHNATHEEWATKDCQTCHQDDSRLNRPIQLASYVPGGIAPGPVPGAEAAFIGRTAVVASGGLEYQPSTSAGGLYIFGHDRVDWIGTVGVAVFLVVLGGMSVHGGLRVYSSVRQARAEPQTRQVYMYSAYERAWHWLQALAIILLSFTGMIIHLPSTFSSFSFPVAIQSHNVVGMVLAVNAALAVFYYFASGSIRHYLPEPKGFFGQALAQTKYYLRGILRGERHPFEKSPERRLNPLQQITYIVILNVLLPLQVVTGIMMWGAQRWPELTERLGGLPNLAPLHTLVAWLFLAFMVLHIYLTTTGHTPTSNIRAMIVGWDEVEAQDEG